MNAVCGFTSFTHFLVEEVEVMLTTEFPEVQGTVNKHFSNSFICFVSTYFTK